MRYFMLFEYYFKFIVDVLWSMLRLMDINCDICLYEGNKELRVGRNKKKVNQFCYLVNKPFTASFDSLVWVKSWLYVEFELNNATFNIMYEESISKNYTNINGSKTCSQYCMKVIHPLKDMIHLNRIKGWSIEWTLLPLSLDKFDTNYIICKKNYIFSFFLNTEFWRKIKYIFSIFQI
jgi:hypothetical protein